MNPICLGVWYIVFTACAIIALIIRLVRSFDTAIRELVLYILIASIIYGAYMLFYFFSLVQSTKSKDAKSKEDKSKGEKKSNDESNFIKDNLFKYLFVLALGVIFLSQIIELFVTYFKGAFPKEEWYNSVERSCSQFIVPIFILIDIFLIPRRRVIKPKLDLIIFLVVIAAFLFFVLIRMIWDWNTISKHLAALLKSLIFTFDSYVLYDFILYKKSGSSGGYYLFNETSSSNKKSKSDSQKKEEDRLKSDNIEKGTK